LAACEVPGSDKILTMVATSAGLVVGLASPDPGGLTVWRWAGEGCALAPDGKAPVALAELSDADDQGTIYGSPRFTAEPGVLTTLQPEESVLDTRVRVDVEGKVSTVVSGGRGIWGFGVSPGGGTLWVTACGPTGIFSMKGEQLEIALPAPDTLWEQMPSALTGDQIFWSVGVRTCSPYQATTPACGYALVRTDPAGSREVGATLIDLGAGFEQAQLARCGARVCGLLSRAVIVWNDDGSVRRTLAAADFGGRPSEQIARVSGNQSGVYLQLHDGIGSRVVFVPVP
jgi:hypothetical protein